MSFLSVEPQSRVVLDNYSNSLLAQFDSQFGIIADRYLAFFQERYLSLVLVLRSTLLTVQFPDEISKQLSQSHPNSRTSHVSSSQNSFLKCQFFTETSSQGKNR